MVNAEGRGDGADSPVLAEIEAANFRVLFGRDQGTPPGTRDGLASAVEGATRFGGRRPYIATRPPGTRSANPSACRAEVCATPGRDGKSDPSRARDRRAGDRDGRAVLQASGDGAAARPRSIGAVRCDDTSRSSTRAPDHTRHKSRRAGCRGGRFSGEGACPRRRSGSAHRLDTATKPWHKREDWLGPSEHRGGHRGSGGISSRPSPHSPQRAAYATAARAIKRAPAASDDRWLGLSRSAFRSRGGARRHPPLTVNLSLDRRQAPAGLSSTLAYLQQIPTTTDVQIYAVSDERRQLKLGIDVWQATVAKYLVRRRQPPSQTWRTLSTNGRNGSAVGTIARSRRGMC